jgi:hypothetical protein
MIKTSRIVQCLGKLRYLRGIGCVKRCRFSEEEIIAILRELEAGQKTAGSLFLSDEQAL